MATVTKNFKIKHGLVVEGTTGTINNFDILTKSTDDQQYIVDLVGGDAASNAVANTIVLRDGFANFAANTITADLVGDVTGQVSTISNFDTDDLAEGNALYFTSQRAIDALANAISDLEDYADFASGNALGNANSYTDNAISNATSTLETYANNAAGNALADAEDYTDSAISNLIANAPALLDTLNEIAAAIGDDANFVGTITNLVAEKQNALIPGTDIDIVGNTISFTGSYDPSGSASNAYTTATSYTDNAIGLLSTTDIEEGTNEYFTDTRARASAATLLTMATLTNISITGNSTGLVITAENGVGDSNTDALVEGTTNLYFTDQRAVDALEAVIPNFTEIDINTVARQVAATVNAPTASTVTAIDWALAEYRSAEFLVKVAYGAHTEISKVMLTLDTSNNIAITEYAIVGTNGSASTISADVNGTDVRLRVATANNNSDVTVVGTLLV